MKNFVFIQARIGSTRFPSKVLKKICGKSIIHHIFERTKYVNNIEKILLVTGPKNQNQTLIDEAKNINLDYFCGNENNILDRFYNASLKFKPEIIIRVTADCPVIDFPLINKGLEIFSKNNYDVLSVGRRRTFPHGFDFEIIRKSSLNEAWKDNLERSGKDRFSNTIMNPSQYLLQNPKFSVFDLKSDTDFSSIRLTVDYPEDLELVTEIYESLYYKNPKFSMNEILNLLSKRPELLDINKKYVIKKTD